ETLIQVALTSARTELPLASLMKYALPCRRTLPFSPTASEPPSSRAVGLPSTKSGPDTLASGAGGGLRQTATWFLPMRAATALFTDASGHVGAPDACRA